MTKKTITLNNVKLYKPKSKSKQSEIAVEKEHTPQKRVAKIIAGNHNDEHNGHTYYPALKKMEKKLKSTNKGKK